MRSPDESNHHFHRRDVLKYSAASAVALLASRSVFAAEPFGGWTALVDRATQALDQHSSHIIADDRFAVVDFTLPSSVPRMLLVDRKRNKQQLLRVAHGRGSDPEHSGWLQRFSNADGSNASSRGAYVTGALYTGKHGRSQRLIGLEESNNNAEERAIVIHGAWYSNDDMVSRLGKLGRSEGCFAVSETQIDALLEWLGPGRLLYADKA